MDKRGFIRTLEAIFAVIIVFVFIYYVSGGAYNSSRDVQNIRSLQESILGEISRNDDIRNCVVGYEPLDKNSKGGDDISEGTAYKEVDGPCYGLNPTVDEFIKNSLPPKFQNKFKFNVCDPLSMGSCTLPTEVSRGKEVYTSAVIITSGLKGSGTYKPRILRLWLY